MPLNDRKHTKKLMLLETITPKNQKMNSTGTNDKKGGSLKQGNTCSAMLRLIFRLNMTLEEEKKKNEPYRKMVHKVITLKCDHPELQESISSDPVLQLIYEKDQFKKMLEILKQAGFINEQNHSVCRSHFKCRMILMGVIYLMIECKFFNRMYIDKNQRRMDITDELIVKRMAKSWNVKRRDQIKGSGKSLINLALACIPQLNEFINPKR